MRTLLVFAIGLPLVAACGAARTEDLDSSESNVVYGADGRQDVYEAAPELAAIARSSMVAIFDDETLDESNASNITADADTLAKYKNLCKGQRFATQPAGSDCSGTLIGEDLILTAGHCFESEEGLTPAQVCKKLRFAFDWYYDGPNRLHPMTSDSVYGCGDLLVHSNDPDGAPSPRLDYAIVKLDRAPVGRTPLRVNMDGAKENGAPLVVIGAPTGLPLKVEPTARVKDARAEESDYFYAIADTFAGNSGSGVLDARTLEVVGLLVSGSDDYVKRGACWVVNTCKETGCKDSEGEEIGRVANPIAALCEAHPEESLCNVP